MARERAEVDLHLRFVCELYQMQLDAGRYFLHEHPNGATSWDLSCIRQVLAQHGVKRIRGDQCQCGPGYSGSHCQEDVDECQLGPAVHRCGAGSVCVNR